VGHRWSYGETKSNDPGVDKGPVVGAMNRIVDGMKVELDREALIKGVRNWKELKTAAGSIVDVLRWEKVSGWENQEKVSGTNGTRITQRLSPE